MVRIGEGSDSAAASTADESEPPEGIGACGMDIMFWNDVLGWETSECVLRRSAGGEVTIWLLGLLASPALASKVNRQLSRDVNDRRWFC